MKNVSCSFLTFFLNLYGDIKKLMALTTGVTILIPTKLCKTAPKNICWADMQSKSSAKEKHGLQITSFTHFVKTKLKRQK